MYSSMGIQPQSRFALMLKEHRREHVERTLQGALKKPVVNQAFQVLQESLQTNDAQAVKAAKTAFAETLFPENPSAAIVGRVLVDHAIGRILIQQQV